MSGPWSVLHFRVCPGNVSCVHVHRGSSATYRQNTRDLPIVRLDIEIDFDREPCRLVFRTSDPLRRDKDHTGDHMILSVSNAWPPEMGGAARMRGQHGLWISSPSKVGTPKSIRVGRWLLASSNVPWRAGGRGGSFDPEKDNSPEIKTRGSHCLGVFLRLEKVLLGYECAQELTLRTPEVSTRAHKPNK